MTTEPFQLSDDTIPPDTVFHLLSHAYRRAVLGCLDQHEGALPLTDLAESVAVQNSEYSTADVPATDVERVHLSLYHSHVPKLAEAGVITHERERGLVELTDRGRQLVSLQKRVTEPATP